MSEVLPPLAGRDYDRKPKKILAVVTAGGYTNAAPLMQMAAILSSRGHTVELATLAGRDDWLKEWPFLSRLHVLGSAIPPDVEEKAYLRMSEWTADLISSWGAVFDAKRFLESSWPDAYRSIKRLVLDPATRPDFILADYWVEAALDVSVELNVPIAMLWPQMPTGMLRAPYIPGAPGLQVGVLTSEFATVWQRLWSEVVMYTSLTHLLRYERWKRRMRASAGVTRRNPSLGKPEYLCLVNSFIGLEAAKDLPPNVVAVGPLIPDDVASLDSMNEASAEPFASFLQARSRVLYIALGTHVLFSHGQLHRILSGAMSSLASGAIDGIIWALHDKARKQLDHSAAVDTEGGKTVAVGRLLNNCHRSILFVNFAPQRTLLHDSRIALFLSHAGPSSTNEAVFAGVPLITLPVYFDQVQNSLRLRDAGVSVALDKDRFTAADVVAAVASVMEDMASDGPTAANVLRLRGIARVAARRKQLAADLVEETMADWEGRWREQQLLASGSKGIEPGIGGSRGWRRGPHLQTADVRMSIWKARNWDLMAIVACGGLLSFALVIGAIHAVC